jgi:hypothetical protein
MESGIGSGVEKTDFPLGVRGVYAGGSMPERHGKGFQQFDYDT